MVGDGSLQLTVLGSGSSGNCVVVRGGGTTVLVDAGLSLKEVRLRMESLGLDAGTVDALLITHEHGDHVSQASRVARHLGVPIHLNDGTRRAAERFFPGGEELVPFHTGRPFRVGALGVEPVPKPHDAADPVAFLISHGGRTVGVLTDLGHVDGRTGEAMARCSALVMESNHDAEMLSRGPYPPRLRRRVGGRLGHISNEDSARALGRWISAELRLLILGHVSLRNNTPDLVRASSVRHLGACPGFPRYLSSQRRPTPLLAADGTVVSRARVPAARAASSGTLGGPFGTGGAAAPVTA